MSKSFITGYQIELATNNEFTENRKRVSVKGYKKSSRRIYNLKDDKTYFARIRTYKTINGKNIFLIGQELGWQSKKRIKKFFLITCLNT